MSNTFAVPSSKIIQSVVDAHAPLQRVKETKDRHKALRSPELLKKRIVESKVDVKFLPSVLIPLEYLRDKHALEMAKGGVHVASSTMEGLSARLRTLPSSQLINIVVKQLEPNHSLYSKVVGGCRSSMFASCGALGAFGRYLKYAPKVGGMEGVVVPTVAEVSLAVLGCGIPNTREMSLVPLSIINEGEGSECIMVAVKSGLGYPTLSKTDDQDAVSIHQSFAHEMLSRLQDVEEYEDAKAILDADRELHPYKYIMVGKAKADVYDIEKVLNDGMRFYTLVPFWQRAILMSVLQRIAQHSLDFLISEEEDERRVVHIASKMSFAHGGAMKMALKIERQVDKFGYSYLFNGDDTMIILRIGNLVLAGSVDMSSFDLTQLTEVMQPLRRKLYEKLQYVDSATAFFYRWLKESPKRVAAFGIGVLEMKHSSPSGMPGVSLENSMLASVVCSRIIAAWKRDESRFKGAGMEREMEVKAWFASTIDSVGKSLGLEARVDDAIVASYEQEFTSRDGGKVLLRGLRRVIAEIPFLFLGYNLFLDGNGAVVCYQDIARSMKNLAYPTKLFIEDPVLFKLYDAMRIMGTIMNLGYYPMSYIASQSSALFREGCEKLPIVDGQMVPLLGIMKTYMRGYLDKHGQSLLDLYLPESVTSNVNPFTGLNFEKTLRGMLTSLDKELFYPLGDPNALLFEAGLHSFKEEVDDADVEEYLSRVQPTGSWTASFSDFNAGEVVAVITTMKPVRVKVKTEGVKRAWMDKRAEFFGKMPPLVGPVASLKQIASHKVRSVLVRGKSLAGLRMANSKYSVEESESVYDESIGQVDSEYFGGSEVSDFRDNWSVYSEDDDKEREEHKEWIKDMAVDMEEYFPNVNVN